MIYDIPASEAKRSKLARIFVVSTEEYRRMNYITIHTGFIFSFAGRLHTEDLPFNEKIENFGRVVGRNSEIEETRRLRESLNFERLCRK